ncbi:MAG: phosphomannomutase/phosphoglucomutase [bacterium]
MQINPNIFRAYDLRGLVDTDLTPEIVEHIGRAHATYMKKHGITKALVSRDCRATSQEYSEAIMRGFSWAGVDSVDIGLNLVGTFYWAQHFLKIKGGAFVTASHNPAEFNGFKLAIDLSETLVSDGMSELRRLVQEEDYTKAEIPGTISQINIREEYFNDLLSRLPIKKGLKVVIDPSCSTAGVIAPDLLRRAGCEVIERNCTIDPSFPLGTPDPTEILVAERVKASVLESGADLGLSYDADGDRIGIVDEKGGIIWNDVLVAIFAADVLRQHPGAKIMYNTLCSKIVEDTIKLNGGTPFMWRTGHSFLKKKNQEINAAFIGELSGHFFFSKDFYNHDDGLYSTMRLLHYLSSSEQSLSEIVASLPKYISSAEIKLGCADDKKVKLIEKLSVQLLTDFPEADVISDERAGDGVRLNLSDAMLVVRYSQNGPYLTIKFEAKTSEKYDQLKKYLKALLLSQSEINWDFGVNTEGLD